MKRRNFFLFAAGAAAASLAFLNVAHAQSSRMPVIGWFGSTGADTNAYQTREFRRGLKELGYAEGENVTVEYRWAENQFERLPAMAADLARRRVTLIVTGGPPAAMAAKAATSTIPVVFVVAQDPVRLGLVGSFARPSGNLTGIYSVTSDVSAKRLELLREMVPDANRIGVLVNSANVEITEANLRDIERAARLMGLSIQVLHANSASEIDAAFVTLARERPGALFLSSSPFVTSRRVQLVNQTTRHAIPTMFPNREHTDVGGLMSYGANVGEGYRQLGIYAGRILKGAKPTDLPVSQLDKLELIINAQTARIIGVPVPPPLLARADEVIE